MIRTSLAALAVLAFTTSASAQSVSQNQIEERYDRALAAGYKALFLCGAIANAERNGVNRSVEHVEAMELTGTYSRIQSIMPELDFRILRDADRRVAQVEVDWDDTMAPRFAEASREDGCRLAPIGLKPPMPEMAAPVAPNTDAAPPLPPMISTFTNVSPYKDVVEAALAGSYGEGTRTTAVVVGERDSGFSRYAEGYGPYTPQRTWSVAKSIAATLVGSAVYRGEADLEARSVFGDWRWDRRRSISIDHLLRMASGRYSDTPGNRTDPLYMGGATVGETATGWPLVYEPGTVFRYANNDTLMAIKAIESSLETYSPSDFFADAGMTGTVAETDWAGDYILSSQVWTTAEDLATLGRLHLNDGVTDGGKRVLPSGWLNYISRASGPQPSNGFGYGAAWWLFNDHEGIPPDTIAAMGNRGQYLVIVPSRDLVIVRRGEDPAGSRFDIVAFTRDVLAAME